MFQGTQSINQPTNQSINQKLRKLNSVDNIESQIIAEKPVNDYNNTKWQFLCEFKLINTLHLLLQATNKY